MSSRQQQKAEARERRVAAQQEREAQERRRRVMRLVAVAVGAVAAIVTIALVAGGGDDDSDTEQAGGGAGSGGTAAETNALYRGIPQDGTSLGNPRADVVLTEYADLQCPFCAEYSTSVLPELIETYVRPGRLRLELRLLRFLGPDSDRGAYAALVAADHDRMWQFVDLWYRNQGPENSDYATDDFIADLAEGASVPADEAVEAAGTSSETNAIARMEESADLLGIDSTPSFVVGPEGGQGEPLEVGELSFEAFQQALEPMLE